MEDPFSQILYSDVATYYVICPFCAIIKVTFSNKFTSSKFAMHFRSVIIDTRTCNGLETQYIYIFYGYRINILIETLPCVEIQIFKTETTLTGFIKWLKV